MAGRHLFKVQNTVKVEHGTFYLVQFSRNRHGAGRAEEKGVDSRKSKSQCLPNWPPGSTELMNIRATRN